MYEEHPYFKVPSNELTEIWKYMDFVQFISLLDRRELYFRRSSKFEDPYEGLYSNANLNEIHLLEQSNEKPILLNNLKEIHFFNVIILYILEW